MFILCMRVTVLFVVKFVIHCIYGATCPLPSSNSESSDCEQESQPGPSIKRKINCNYKSKFSKEWTKTWPFIMVVPGPSSWWYLALHYGGTWPFIMVVPGLFMYSDSVLSIIGSA